MANSEAPAPERDQLLYSFPDAAARLGMSRTRVFELVRNGKLEAVEISLGRRMIRATELDDYVARLPVAKRRRSP